MTEPQDCPCGAPAEPKSILTRDGRFTFCRAHWPRQTTNPAHLHALIRKRFARTRPAAILEATMHETKP